MEINVEMPKPMFAKRVAKRLQLKGVLNAYFHKLLDFFFLEHKSHRYVTHSDIIMGFQWFIELW